jgi:hypothetical protein
MNRHMVKSVILALIASLVGVTSAFAAYVDPNTGGMLFQLLAVLFTVFSGILLFFSARIRMAFARVVRFVRGLFEH